MSETRASKPPEPSVHEKPLTSEKQYLAMVQATINEKWIAPPVTDETPVVLKFRIAKSREISIVSFLMMAFLLVWRIGNWRGRGKWGKSAEALRYILEKQQV